MRMTGVPEDQARICEKYGVSPVPAPPDLKVGLGRNVRNGMPVNGLRHPPEAGTTGWFIWAGGEPSPEDDFFEPVHVAHLAKVCPEVLPYLSLPPGWRFQVAPGHEDVWRDDSLLIT